MTSPPKSGNNPSTPVGASERRTAIETVTSTARIVVYSLLASFSVLLVALMMQRFIYQDWLHDTGPLRIIGTTIAAIVTFWFVLHWQIGVRQRQLETLRRFEVIAEMNDRIRNKLQSIECLIYASDESLTKSVRDAVESIDAVLQGIVTQSRATVVEKDSRKHAATAGSDRGVKPRSHRGNMRA